MSTTTSPMSMSIFMYSFTLSSFKLPLPTLFIGSFLSFVVVTTQNTSSSSAEVARYNNNGTLPNGTSSALSPVRIPIPINTSSSSSSSSPFLSPSSIQIFGVPAAQISVECKEPLMGATTWDCGIEEADDQLDQAMMGGRESEWRTSSTGSASWEQRHGKRQFHVGPLELYYSNKVNQTDGKLFISALARWQFHSALPHRAYRIHLWIKEVADGEQGTSREHGTGNNTSNDGNQKSIRQFVIPMALRDGFKEENSHSAHRAELLFRIDAFFRFEHSYEMKILCLVDHDSLLQSNDNNTIFVGRALKRISFAGLYDELDTDGCPDEEGQPKQKSVTKVELVRRRAMASRWAGALRSVSFFPLHAAINISFFAAPPSHCIGAYRVQLWLLNALQNEQTVMADQLIRIGPNGYVGSAEFRNLLSDERMKYRVKVIPMEHFNGVCVCELEQKCGCVQIYSDPFPLMDSNSSTLFMDLVSPSPPFLIPSDQSSSSDQSSALPLLIAGLFLALTIILLSIALLLLVVRNSTRATHKRRTLLVFGGKRQNQEKSVVSLINKKCAGGKRDPVVGSGAELQSVLLVNAQPKRRNELERFARVLVKNGIRVFYDRWDRARIERNLLSWVQDAVAKSNRIVFFYDHRAEQLLVPSDKSSRKEDDEDLFDQVFRALYEHLERPKTIFVKWDEAKLVDGRPLGALLSESVFLFKRDLRHIFASLRVPVTDVELREIEREHGKSSGGGTGGTTPSLVMVVKPRQRKADEIKREEEEERTELLEGRDSEARAEAEGAVGGVPSATCSTSTEGAKDEGIGTTTTKTEGGSAEDEEESDVMGQRLMKTGDPLVDGQNVAKGGKDSAVNGPEKKPNEDELDSGVITT